MTIDGVYGLMVCMQAAYAAAEFASNRLVDSSEVTQDLEDSASRDVSRLSRFSATHYLHMH